MAGVQRCPMHRRCVRLAASLDARGFGRCMTDLVRCGSPLVDATGETVITQGEPLHDVANGILRGEPPSGLRAAILPLTSMGHSTGWENLARLLAGVLLAKEPEAVPTCVDAEQR